MSDMIIEVESTSVDVTVEKEISLIVEVPQLVISGGGGGGSSDASAGGLAYLFGVIV